MLAVVSPEKIYLSTGTMVRSPATWEEYRGLCDRRGDGSIPRIKYRSGEVFLMENVKKRQAENDERFKILLESAF